MRRHAPLVLIFLVGLACTSSQDPKPLSSSSPSESDAALASAGELPLVVAPTPPAPPQLVEAFARDPFQPGATLADVTTPPPADTTPRKAKRFSLDQLKLVGIVGGEEQPRAMLVDPNGKGWIVTRGDHVGRAENLAGWRVDKVRGDDVVFTRTDPRQPERAAETRVVALHGPAPSDSAEIDD